MLSDDIVITGKRAIARSYAKINLTLDVLGRLKNGYHEVEMLMQTVSLFDLVLVDREKNGIVVSTNIKHLPNNDKNIAYCAARLFLETHGINGGVKIKIHKNIPLAAGLAGGSGNAAAVLCAMDMLFGTNMTVRELCEMGAHLGADVPYCIIGGTQLAQGIGEKLTPVSAAPLMTVLLVKPPQGASTARIYAALDNAEGVKHPNTAAMLDALRCGDIRKIAANLGNAMECVTAEMCPSICEIKEKMLSDGALGAAMSGSGPTVFGIFDDYGAAKACADSFSRRFKDVFLVKTTSI